MRPSDLQVGDVLLYERGAQHGTPLGRLIRLITGSLYTHATIVVQDGNGTLCIAEQEGHVAVIPVEAYKFKVPDKVSVWRNPNLRWFPRIAWISAISLVGTPYGIANLFEVLVQHLMGRIIKNWKPEPILLPEDRTYCTCSGLVAKIMHAGSWGTVADAAFSEFSTIVEPDNFNAARGFVCVGTIDSGN